MKELNLHNQNLRIATVLVIAALLMSCGAKKTESGSSEEASRIQAPTTTSPKALAYCNQATNSGNTFRINLASVDNGSGAVDSNFIHLKITGVPSTFETDTSYFAIWKWYAESSGFSYVSNTPLTFKIVSIETGVDLTGYMSTLSWSQVSSLATTLNVTTAAAFFAKVRLFVNLQDPTAQYDALTISLHNGSTGATASRADMLLPVFSADPREYATESNGSARAPILKALHPFAASDYSLWSVTTFQNKANEFCSAFGQM